MTLDKCLTDLAVTLSDDELRRELQLAERATLLSVRTRRELAWRRLHCLQRELQRRAVHGREVPSASLGEERNRIGARASPTPERRGRSVGRR